MPIAHTLIKVPAAQLAAVDKFYVQALKPLGYAKLRTFPNGMSAFGISLPEWFIAPGGTGPSEAVHVAFAAPGMCEPPVASSISLRSPPHKMDANYFPYSTDRAAVDAFHAQALEAGGVENGAPGLRTHIHPNYYAAFAVDPAGNNIEAVCMNEPEN